MNIELAKVVMEFRSSPASKVTFPFDFVLRMGVDLGRAGFRTLALEITIENTGSRPMPVHFGLHPYFFVSDQDRDRVRVEVDASYAYDNNSGDSGPWNGRVDLTQPGVDLHLTDLQSQTVLLHVPGRTPRRIEMSELFTTVVLWQSAMQDFLCVEPWSAPGDAFNTRVCLRTLEPGDSLSGEVVISV
jgi:galactose mutarotase-like enzyme